MPKPLVVIPNHMSDTEDVEILGACLESIRRTASDAVDVLVIDDLSPRQDLVERFLRDHPRSDFELIRKPVNEGFSRTVNVGLERALEEGREAILLNADVELQTPGWLARCRRTRSPDGLPVGVVGALLLYPNGLIQHAGIYFSELAHVFEHRMRCAAGNLAEAQVELACPVTGAFQYIPHRTLSEVGLYDPEFKLGCEDVDFCLRVRKAGLACVYQPRIKAVHHESLFRGRPSPKVARWESESFARLLDKWEGERLSDFAPAR